MHRIRPALEDEYMTRATTIALASFVLLISFSIRASEPKELLEDAWIVITQNSEYPLPGQPKRYKPGLVAAIWPDGRVRMVKSMSDVGNDYVEGMADRRDMRRIREAYSLGSMEHLRDACAPLLLDTATWTVSVKANGTQMTFDCSIGVGNSTLEKMREDFWSISISEDR